MRVFSSRSLAVVFGFAFVYALPSFAQHGDLVDVGKCFPDILRDTTVNFKNTKLRYAALSVWDKELFESAKRSGRLTSLLPALPGNAGFDTSDEQRVKEFYLNDENLAYDEATASAAFFLDPQAGRIIRDCLDRETRKNFGFYTAYFNDNERHTTLGLYWNWVPADLPLKIKTRSIYNAIVTDDEKKHPYELLAPHLLGWSRLAGRSEFVTLERNEPNDNIIVNLETDPDVGAQHIVIPPVSPKEHCTPIHEIQNAVGEKYHYDSRPIAPESLKVTEDDGKGHKYYHLTQDIHSLQDGENGVISYVHCSKVAMGAPTDFNEIINPGNHIGSVAFCDGWWQERGRQIMITIDWYKIRYDCQVIPWETHKLSTKATR